MNLSDEALELLDGMTDLGILKFEDAASGTQIMNSLEVKIIDGFREWISELMENDLVRKRPPRPISEVAGYYVNAIKANALFASCEARIKYYVQPKTVDWSSIRNDVKELNDVLNKSILMQSQRAQAGALISSVSILVESPNPPKDVIQNILYDIAAIATIFALAIQIADKIK